MHSGQEIGFEWAGECESKIRARGFLIHRALESWIEQIRQQNAIDLSTVSG